ncbi:MAG: dipeptide/oligopeptide/nickel ABC transporter ATP-binding protein [Sporomusaceae bacterium]|nr:dipeptide/oligopeptide/nickel ABC transporter ATP-binding protein [Sporomusaceae bacterium]
MLSVSNISKSYLKSGGLFARERQLILNRISFSVKRGECVGLIGESGSGKSTLARLLLGIERPDSGEILVEGRGLREWRQHCPGQMSVVFQDYTTSVSPRFTVAQIVAEPLFRLERAAAAAKVAALLERVGLPAALSVRYPHELSGGQLQRVCLARAISTQPRFIVLDEALSSLDVSVQAQIMELLKDLKAELQLTYLFIAHDLQTVANLCDQVLFLYQGQLVEQLPVERLFETTNEYARKLLNSVIPFGDCPVCHDGHETGY